MPAKKTPAQLQRDIDEVLARSGNDDDGGSGVQFGSAGTKVSIEPTPSARRRGGKGLIHKTRKYGVLMEDARIGPGGGWDVYDVRLPDGSETSAYGFDLRLAPSAIFREAIKKRKRSHAAKKTKGRPPVVGSHGLGTADVRTGEGAYWIVTRPTGYRVDYKPWGPSNEVDLGTFPSRRHARSKITEHARSMGATIVS